MKRLGASFCVLEPGWARRSRTQTDIEKWLHDISQGIARDWELVIIQDVFISRQAVPNFAKNYFLETLPKPNLLNLRERLANRQGLFIKKGFKTLTTRIVYKKGLKTKHHLDPIRSIMQSLSLCFFMLQWSAKL